MNFLIHVLGVLAKFDIPRHPWVKGLIRKCEQERPPLKQSRVLTAKEVSALESLFIEGDLQPIDRYALGCFLFLIFAISRVSDVSFLDIMTLDIQEGLDETSNPGYLEATLRASFLESLMLGAGRVTASRPARQVHGLTSF